MNKNWMPPKTKIIVALGTAALTSVVGYNVVYLPFYSDLGKTRKEQAKKMREEEEKAEMDAAAATVKSKSMWKNMDSQMKQPGESRLRNKTQKTHLNKVTVPQR